MIQFFRLDTNATPAFSAFTDYFFFSGFSLTKSKQNRANWALRFTMHRVYMFQRLFGIPSIIRNQDDINQRMAVRKKSCTRVIDIINKTSKEFQQCVLSQHSISFIFCESHFSTHDRTVTYDSSTGRTRQTLKTI